VRVICESKRWIEMDSTEWRHSGCPSRSRRCGERHGWRVRKSQAMRSGWRVAKQE